jgi:hypothetical protein
MKYIKIKNFFVLLLSLMVFFSIGFSMVAHADDDEEGKDDEDRYEQQAVQPATETVTTPREVKVEKPKTVTQTIVDPPTTIVTYQTSTVEYADNDRDGLVDSLDPHPTVAEIYFVKDVDFNGIVDTFEYYEDYNLNGVVDVFENYDAS